MFRPSHLKVIRPRAAGQAPYGSGGVLLSGLSVMRPFSDLGHNYGDLFEWMYRPTWDSIGFVDESNSRRIESMRYSAGAILVTGEKAPGLICFGCRVMLQRVGFCPVDSISYRPIGFLIGHIECIKKAIKLDSVYLPDGRFVAMIMGITLPMPIELLVVRMFPLLFSFPHFHIIFFSCDRLHLGSNARRNGHNCEARTGLPS